MFSITCWTNLLRLIESFSWSLKNNNRMLLALDISSESRILSLPVSVHDFDYIKQGRNQSEHFKPLTWGSVSHTVWHSFKCLIFDFFAFPYQYYQAFEKTSLAFIRVKFNIPLTHLWWPVNVRVNEPILTLLGPLLGHFLREWVADLSLFQGFFPPN